MEKTKRVKIDISKMNIGEYQKDLNMNTVKKIVREYDPIMVEPIRLSLRKDGSYWVIDGQHTRKALEILFGDHYEAECDVYTGMTFEDEAAFFVKWNTKGKQPSYNDKLKALWLSGEKSVREYITCFYETATPFTWRRGRETGQYCICAHNAAFRSFQRVGKEIFKRALAILKAANNAEMGRGEVISGLCTLLKVCPEINNVRLSQTLRATNIFDLRREITSFKGTLDGSGANINVPVARAILNLYNKGLKTNRIEQPIKFN